MDGRHKGDDAALGGLAGLRLRQRYRVDTLTMLTPPGDLVAIRIDRNDLANETAIFAADHHDAVALTDVQSGFGLSRGLTAPPVLAR